ncbi:ras-related protein RABC2a-like isoform X2 [Carya illinoinensis]|uniref:ras-related protein RABC2a-like isoform X2 n=1 Tax=Carya illinoinensis TaxID=32201 RepID=UPI001C71F854|nr:ras-related protein RABC2a-like isoform X2 [Carya illinoinensis]
MCINITIRGPVFSSSSFHFLPLYPPLLFTVLFCTHFLNLFSSLSFLITRTMKEANAETTDLSLSHVKPVWKRPTRHAQDGYFVKGVDFKIKLLTVGGKKLKLTIWDTAGQERFRTLTSSYFRGAQGIILVYDVTRRDTFTNLSDVWAKEVELYSTNQDCVKMLVGNKVDMASERVVTREEGIALAKELGCLFIECSARTRENVEQCFEELALKVMLMLFDIPLIHAITFWWSYGLAGSRWLEPPNYEGNGRVGKG